MKEAAVNVPAAPTVAGFTGFCRAFLEAREGPWILAGNSLGGLAALTLSREMPDQVRAVIASGVPGLGEMSNLGIGTTAMLSPTYARSIRDKLFANPEVVTDEMIQRALDQLKGASAAKAGVRLMRSLRTVDVSDDLAQVVAPTALIWGEEDRVTPGNRWREAVAGLTPFSFKAIAGSGHSPMFETPLAFNAELQRFLETIAPLGQDGAEWGADRF